MDRFRIEGGRRLEGTVRISGAKNAALPAMAAALLTAEPVHLKNIPRVRDIITMAKLLAHMSARVETPDVPPTDLTIEAETISDAEAPYELVRTMRASILTLGPLVGRLGHARVSLPGGCAIGARPVDLHIQGARTDGRGDCHRARLRRSALRRRLRGAHIRLRENHRHRHGKYSDGRGAGRGRNRLENAAREPEVTDLVDLLIKMGAQIEGAGHRRLRVHGVDQLARRDAHDHSRPHRGRHVPGRRRHHRRRNRSHRLRAGASDRDARQASRNAAWRFRSEGAPCLRVRGAEKAASPPT